MIRKILIAAILCAGCKDSVIPVSTNRGTYAMRTIDGNALPYTLPGTQTVIVADSITLMEGSVFHESGTKRVTVNGITTESAIIASGGYSLLGTSFTIHNDADGTNRTGQLDGDTMTILDTGKVEVLKKLH